jgi:hypothetical protein
MVPGAFSHNQKMTGQVPIRSSFQNSSSRVSFNQLHMPFFNQNHDIHTKETEI